MGFKCFKKMGLWAVVIFAALQSPLFVHAMSLDQYLDQVKKDNLSYRASTVQAEGARLQESEAALLFSPTFFADFTYGDDARPPNPRFYDAIKTEKYSLGISQKFDFGLEAKLYYDFTGSEFINPNPLLTMASFWDASPRLELRLPVWGGGLGKTERANETLIKQQSLSQQYANQAEARRILSLAESTYWRASIWQEVVSIQEQALKAAQNIYDHVNKKYKMNLGEKSDLVQAKALVEGRKLELETAKNERRAAHRAFNTYINAKYDSAIPALQKVNYEWIETLSVPSQRPGDRLDVKALQAQADAAKANAALVKERNRPRLDFFGNVALHGQEPGFSQTLEQSFRTDYDSKYIGLNLSIPLNFGAVKDVETGAIKAQQASELSKEFALYNQEQEWINLIESIKDIQSNLKLLTSIESTQKTKLETERKRFKEGRTTTFQVLMFEQDYSQASVARAKTSAQILDLWAQLKLYNE